MAICWVGYTYDVHENFLRLVHVPSTTSVTLTAAIKDVLIRCILPLSYCRGQSYDGATNMMGHLRGVARRIEGQPSAIKVHCLAHCLNLCLQSVSRKCQPIQNALDVTIELSKLILYSPKRTQIFQQFKQEVSPEGTGLHPLCPTRWTVRTEALNSFIRNYSAIAQALQQISDESYDDYGRRANGILSLLQRFNTFFGIKLSCLIFSATEQTSINLQKKDTSVQEALACAEVATNHMKKMRTDESFSHFYDSTVEEAKELTDDPALPRYKRPPKKLDEGERPHAFKVSKDVFRMHYFFAIYLILQEISDHFDQKSLQLPK